MDAEGVPYVPPPMCTDIARLFKPPPQMILHEQDRRRVEFVYNEYVRTKAAKNYARSDRLRGYLLSAGCVPPTLNAWHPAFESGEHYRRRVKENGLTFRRTQ